MGWDPNGSRDSPIPIRDFLVPGINIPIIWYIGHIVLSSCFISFYDKYVDSKWPLLVILSVKVIGTLCWCSASIRPTKLSNMKSTSNEPTL